jgi:hypothetical protein
MAAKASDQTLEARFLPIFGIADRGNLDAQGLVMRGIPSSAWEALRQLDQAISLKSHLLPLGSDHEFAGANEYKTMAAAE